MPSATPELDQTGERRRWLRVLRLAALVALVSCPLATAAAQGEVTIPPPRTLAERPDSGMGRPVGGLRPGDLLKVAVYGNQQLSGEFLIDSRGELQIPGLGIIRVAGMDPVQAREQIVGAIKQRLGVVQPEIAVQALVRVTVLGAVRSPALYPVEPGTNLVQLLAAAGGPTERADLRRTRVVRDGREFVVDLESGLAGSGAGRVILYANDIVNVPNRSGFTRENAQFLLSLLAATISVATLITTLQR